MKLETRLARVELLLLDVDGVLTDGRIAIDDRGVETKCFDVTDGHGLKLLQRSGVAVGIVTGRTSRSVEHRAGELGIQELHQGVRDKLGVLRQILRRRRLDPEQVAYVGDDLVDLPVLLRVGVGIAVADASPYVRERVHWVVSKGGGRGAVREVCEAILRARGAWESVTDRYFSPERL